MKVWRTRIASKIAMWLVLLVLITQCLFPLWNIEEYRGWDWGSDALVIGRVYLMQHGKEELAPGGFMFRMGDMYSKVTEPVFLSDEPIPAYESFIYLHCSGIQATLLGILNRVLCLLRIPAQRRLDIMRWITLFLFLCVTALFAGWLWKEWNALSAVLAAVAVLASPWTWRLMGNLYWQCWLMLLPMVLCAWLCRYYADAERLPWWSFAAVGGGAFAGFLCGFEFTPTILIAMELPVLYYWLTRAGEGKKWLRTAVGMGAAALTAFFAAVVALVWQLSFYTGSLRGAVEEFLRPVLKHVGAENAVQTLQSLGQVEIDSMNVPRAEVLRMYLFDRTVVAGLPMIWIILLWAVFAVVSVLLLRRAGKPVGKLIAVGLLCLVALLAPVSWFVLGRVHAVLHFHLCAVLWSLFACPFLFAHIGLCLEQLRSIARERKIVV